MNVFVAAARARAVPRNDTGWAKLAPMANDPVVRGIKLGRNPRPPTTVNKEVALLKAMLNLSLIHI